MNIELGERLVTYLKDHPKEHNQDHWGLRTACGTTLCTAGHTSVTLAGDIPLWEGSSLRSVFQMVIPRGEPGDYPVGGIFVAQRAKSLLEISWKEADWLFFAPKLAVVGRIEALIEYYRDGAPAPFTPIGED